MLRQILSDCTWKYLDCFWLPGPETAQVLPSANSEATSASLPIHPDLGVIHRCDTLHASQPRSERGKNTLSKVFWAENIIMCKAAAPNIDAELQ